MCNSVILEWSIQGGPFQCTIFRPYLSTVVLNHPVLGTYSAIFCLSLLVICKLVLVTEILLTKRSTKSTNLLSQEKSRYLHGGVFTQ